MSSTLNSRALRMLDWLVIAVVLALFVWLLAPQQLPVSLYKLSLVAMAGVCGYWIDRSLFPYARPDSFLVFDADDKADKAPGLDWQMLRQRQVADQPMLRLMGVAMLRRAIIVAAAMVSVSLGA